MTLHDAAQLGLMATAVVYVVVIPLVVVAALVWLTWMAKRGRGRWL